MILSQTTETNLDYLIANRDTRIDANGFMPAYDKHSDEVIGKVINLSATGVSLLIGEYHDVDDEIHMVIEHVDAKGNHKEIELRCKLKWIKKSSENKMFKAGFEIEFGNLKSKMRYSQLIQYLA